MAADKTFKIVMIVDSSGAIKGMKMVNAETEKFVQSQGEVQKSQVKTTKGAKNYVERNKGVAGATNNSTHAFAKMAQQMNGIVPVYATVAANVFAITAAFGALERAADFKILIDSADTLAVQTGRSLTSLAENMKDITGSAITMKEALVQASIAASAGFDNSTIEQLTQVARNASVALGREMTDSLNRVFKGAIKAEPELLDELGIILRLETAANKYATTLGKTAKELTTFEKQQAVVNEVLAQGEKKFGRLGDVDPNPFTQLSAAFSEITISLVNMINTPISGFISFFTENIASLTAVIILLASSVAKQALPALAAMGEGAIASFTAVGDSAKKAQAAINKFADQKTASVRANNVADQLNSSLEKLRSTAKATSSAKIFDTSASAADRLKSALNNVKNQLRAITVESNKTGIITPQLSARREELFKLRDSYKLLNEQIVAGTVRTNNYAIATNLAAVSVKALTGTVALAAGAMAGFAISMSNSAKHVSSAVGLWATLQEIILQTQTAASKADGKIVSFSKNLGAFAGGVGAGLLKLVPVVAIATIAFQVLGTAFTFLKNALGFEDIAKVTEALKAQSDALLDSAKAAENFFINIEKSPDTLANVNEKLTLQSNILQGLSSDLKAVNNSISINEGFSWLDELLDFFDAGKIDITKENAEKILNQIDKLGFKDSVSPELRKMIDTFIQFGGATETMNKKLGAIAERLTRVSKGALEANVGITDSIENLNKYSGKAFSAVPSLSPLQKGLNELINLNNRLEASTPREYIDAISALSSVTRELFGIGKFSDQIGDFTKIEIATLKFIEKIEKRAAAIVIGGMDSGVLEERKQNLLDTAKALRTGLDDLAIGIRKKIDEPLDSAIEKFTKIVNATRNLKQQLLGIELDKLNVGNDSTDRIALLTRETKLKIEAFRLEDDRFNTAKNAAKVTVDAADANLQKLKEGLSVAKILEAQQDKRSSIGVASTQRQTALDTYQKAQLALDKNSGKSAQLVKKLYQGIAKEVNNIVSLQAKGVVGLEARFASANNSLKDATSLLVKLGVRTQSWANTVIASQEELARSAKFNADSGLGTIEALAAQGTALQKNTQDMNEQLALNEKLNGLLFTRADAQDLISANAKAIQEEALQGQLAILNAQRIDPGLSEEARAVKDAAHTLELTKLSQLKKLQDQMSANSIANLKVQAAKTIGNMEQELGFLKQKALKGSLFNKMDREALAIAKLRAKLAGNDPKDIAEIIKLQKDLNKEQRKFDYSKQLQKVAESMNDLADSMGKVAEAMADADISNFASGLELLQDVGSSIDGPLGKLTEGFASAAGASQQYSDQLKSITTAQDEAWDNDTITVMQEQNFELAKQQAGYSAIANAAGGLASAFDEGSAAAKTFTLIQQGAAIASAAAAIAKQGSADPYSAFARIAAMISLMSSVLGAAGIAFGGGGSGSNTIENDYKERIGSDALLDRDLQGNFLVDALDELVKIDTQLFSATRDLQITMKNLGETFERIGALVFASVSGQRITDFANIGESTSQNNEGLVNAIASIGDVFDTLTLGVFGGGFASDLLGSISGALFGSTTVTSSVLDTGIDFSTLIQVTEDGLTGTFSRLDQLSQVLVKTEDSGFLGIGSSSSSSLQEVIGTLDQDLADALGTALDQTLTLVNGLVTTFASSIGGINLQALFGNISANVFGDEFISLFELNAEEAGDAIGLYFSALSSDLLGSVLPFLQDYAIAGEELGETMIRLTANTIKLSNSLSTVDIDLEDIIGSLETNIDIGEQIVFSSIISDRVDAIGNELAMAEAVVSAARARGSIFIRNPNATTAAALKDIDRLSDELAQAILDETTNNQRNYTSEINAASAAAAEAFKLEVVAAWEKELLSNFKDIDEFQEIFAMFSKAIFSESELLDIAISNATDNIDNGFAALINQVQGFSSSDLAAMAEEAGGDLGDTLRIFYEEALDTGLFNADVINGTEIDTAGAAAFATVVKLGASINQLDELLQGLLDAITDLNTQYVQQILLFGKLEKEAALLALAFDFNDALKEAEETGSNIALVEQAFGLERLAIVKEAFEIINDEITTVMDNIVDSVLEVNKASDLFDEIAFSTIKINKLVAQLAKGTNTINLNSLVGDTTGLEDFIDNFQGIIDSLATEGPGNISEEIALVDDLKTAIMDRYALELSLLQEQEQAYKDLSVEIQGYLNDIVLSDQSPLTNFERLGEAESQFLANAANIFSGDEEIAAQATQDLLSSADAYLEAASGFFSIGSEYAKVFDQVTSVLGTIDAELLTKTDETVLAIEILNDTTVEQLMVLDSILVELQANNQATLQSDIAASITEGMLPLIGTITDKLQSIDDGTWTNIVTILDTIATASIPTYESVITPTETFTTDILAGTITPETNLAVGTPFVPEDTIAQIHQGEAIVPQSMAQGLREGTLTLGDVQDNSDIVEAIKELTGVLAISQEDIVDATNRNVNASVDIATNIATQRQAVRTAGVL